MIILSLNGKAIKGFAMHVRLEKGTESGTFGTSLLRTNIPQNEKLERIMKNLCSCLNIDTIYWKRSSRGGKFYRIEGSVAYQSASNTILELSELLIDKRR